MTFKTSVSLIISVTLSLLLVSACTRKRQVAILGFIYSKEQVEVSYNGDEWSPVDSNMRPQPGGLLFFSEEKKVDISTVNFRVKIDSAGVVLLDTFLIIPDSNKSPLISFISPLESMPNREVFTVDKDKHKY